MKTQTNNFELNFPPNPRFLSLLIQNSNKNEKQHPTFAQNTEGGKRKHLKHLKLIYICNQNLIELYFLISQSKIMKKILLFAVIVLCMCAKAYTQVIDIKNTQTSEHVVLAGTKYAMITPDASFINAQNFMGFQSNTLEAGINITEMPMSFDEVLSMFTKDMPPKTGKLLLEKDLVMNGYKAKLYKQQGPPTSAIFKLDNPEKEAAELTTWIMLYGNEKMCLVIGAGYAASSDAVLSDKMEKSLKSFLYLADKEVNPLDQLMFTVNTEDTPLKFADIMMQSSAIYTLDGKTPTEMKSKVGYMVMVLPLAVEEADQEKRAIRGVKKPNDENVEIASSTKVTINGLAGYEVIGYEVNKKSETVLQYSVTLFDKDKCFQLSGSAHTDFETYMKLFRKVSQSFKLKMN